MMKLRSATAAVVCGLGLAVYATGAAAQEVQEDGMLCFAGTAETYVVSENHVYGTYQATATVMPSPEGNVGLASEQIAGVWTVKDGKYSDSGYYHAIDAEANWYAGKYSGAMGADGVYKGTYEYTDGAGKFAGIKGSGTYEPVNNWPELRPGAFQGCNKYKGKYTLG